MFSLAVKLILAILVFANAILAIANFPSLKNPEVETILPWWKRLTKWGLIKIATAVLTVFLVGLNEYRSFISSGESHARQATLEKTIEETKALASTANSIIQTGNFQIDTPLSHGLMFFDFPYDVEGQNFDKDILGPIPYFNNRGELATVVFDLERVFHYEFLAEGTEGGVRLSAGSNTGCPIEIMADSPAELKYVGVHCDENDDGSWWIDYIAPTYSMGIKIKSQKSIRVALAAIVSSNANKDIWAGKSFGKMTINNDLLSEEQLEKYWSYMQDVSISMKIYVDLIGGSPEDQCHGKIEIPMKLDYDQSSDTWPGEVRIVADGAAVIDTCEESPI